jgi:low molecular weight protein-tyrosine phosphatase
VEDTFNCWSKETNLFDSILYGYSEHIVFMNSQLLFLCTGNYYRSRYAELVFNNLASKSGIVWSAFSRGLATEGSQNIGPIASKVLTRLKEQGIMLESPIRYPLQVVHADLQTARLAIALHEPEHRPLMQQRFPYWVDRITYWHIPDLDQMGSDDAFSAIEKQVTELLQHLPA